MSRFNKYLEEPETKESKGLIQKKKVKPIVKESVSRKNPTTTTKLSAESFQLLKIMAFETGQKQIQILDEAILLYFQTLALDNPKLAAQKALQEDYEMPEKDQATIFE